VSDREYHDPTTEEDVAYVYESQARLTRLVGRCLFVFAMVWLPALLITPGVFRTGATASLFLATIAAMAAMVVLEVNWMGPRAAVRDRRGHVPPPPREYQSAHRRLFRDLRDRVQK
jgi:hypothetical protein